ncbi:hypothetical protein N9D02_08250 [Emcibacteraceae bacterium]|uniref:hypothetical protein n=1 Tax=Pseudemcibacter sp. TaxID=2943293 RepID=UPI00231D875A|nr:hypothetical protein [Emcibacteraceae bacterium]MDA9771011.1 hypothetical protein [Emcibacteraceae bacterium]
MVTKLIVPPSASCDGDEISDVPCDTSARPDFQNQYNDLLLTHHRNLNYRLEGRQSSYRFAARLSRH